MAPSSSQTLTSSSSVMSTRSTPESLDAGRGFQGDRPKSSTAPLPWPRRAGFHSARASGAATGTPPDAPPARRRHTTGTPLAHHWHTTLALSGFSPISSDDRI
ncbi:hypothetical protein DCS_03593 [Drechmeria coniospora]|uniref:Uncharacterized protein n=1 Tax=Drechmeria coniospora TaxID=98403 RepID=A0A151GHS8_DRECN|nr:hypothetical protein DCS_03593 [Drechmeria coniospora]KYK56592.1 hypothetical protein DCS_03593 [Drechmeria coniospora]